MKKLIKHFDFTNMKKLPDEYFTIQVGDKWANGELQHYVDDPDNIFFRDGLVIKATYKDGIYRSGRINTKDKFSYKYGKIEINAQLLIG